MTCIFYIAKQKRCALTVPEAWRLESSILRRALGTDDLEAYRKKYCETERHVECKLFLLAKACSMLQKIQNAVRKECAS